MIHLHTMISNTMASAHLDTEGYELSIPEWSGRQTDMKYLNELAAFIELVRTCYREVLQKGAVPVEPANTTTHYFMMHPHAAVETEGVKGVNGPDDSGLEYDFPSFDITEDDLPSQIDRFEAEHPESIPNQDLWTEPATEEELSSQSSNSGDLFEDDGSWDDEDGFWQDGYYYQY